MVEGRGRIVRLRARRLLEVHGADAGGRGAGRAVRVADPPRDGGRSRSCRSPNRWPPREIHKAGQAGAQGGEVSVLQHRLRRGGISGAAPSISSRRTATSSSAWAQLGRSTLRLGPLGSHAGAGRRRRLDVSRRRPSARRIIGVGYIIGPELAALNFSGSVVAWGLLIPLLIYLPGTAVADVPAGGRRATRTGSAWPTPCGATSCGRSRWAA